MNHRPVAFVGSVVHRSTSRRRPSRRRLLALAALTLTVAFVAGACGDDGRTNVGRRYVWRDLPIDRDAEVTSLFPAIVLPAPVGGNDRPAVVVGDDERWTLQTIDDEVGFVTDVLLVDRGYVAVGAVGADDVPVLLERTGEVRPAMWRSDEQGRWTRVVLPAPADGAGWFVGVERGPGRGVDVVAVGRTADTDGDVFALSSDLTAARWTASTIAGGPGLQFAGVVAGAPDRAVVAGRGTTWTLRAEGDWVAGDEAAIGDDAVARFGVTTLGGRIHLVTGPSPEDVAGDVAVVRLGESRWGDEVRVTGARALAAGALENDVVVVTEPFGSGAVTAGRNPRLRLVTIAPDLTVEEDELPVRAADVRSMSLWQPGIPGDATVIAVRRSDGTLRLAGLYRRDA